MLKIQTSVDARGGDCLQLAVNQTKLPDINELWPCFGSACHPEVIKMINARLESASVIVMVENHHEIGRCITMWSNSTSINDFKQHTDSEGTTVYLDGVEFDPWIYYPWVGNHD